MPPILDPTLFRQGSVFNTVGSGAFTYASTLTILTFPGGTGTVKTAITVITTSGVSTLVNISLFSTTRLTSNYHVVVPKGSWYRLSTSYGASSYTISYDDEVLWSTDCFYPGSGVCNASIIMPGVVRATL